MKVARKRTLAIGVLLLAIGIFFSLSYMYSKKNVGINWVLAGTSLNSYDVTGFFNESDELGLDLPALKTNPILMPFNASVIAPNGSEVVFKVDPIGADPQKMEYNYTVLKNGGALDIVEETLGGVEGFVTSSGNYTVRLDRSAGFDLYGDPPPVLHLYRGVQTVYVDYIYRDSLFPFGLALVFVGGGFSLWAFKPKKTVLTRKRLRNKK
jgi:hypothetical protein